MKAILICFLSILFAGCSIFKIPVTLYSVKDSPLVSYQYYFVSLDPFDTVALENHLTNRFKKLSAYYTLSVFKFNGKEYIKVVRDSILDNTNQPGLARNIYKANEKLFKVYRSQKKVYSINGVETTYWLEGPLYVCLLYTSPSPRD